MRTKEIRKKLGISPTMSKQILPMINRSRIRLYERAFRRKEVDLPAMINGNPARCLDVSMGGVRLSSQIPLECWNEIDVELVAGGPIRFRGEIRHVMEDTVGIQATLLDDENRERLATLTA